MLLRVCVCVMFVQVDQAKKLYSIDTAHSATSSKISAATVETCLVHYVNRFSSGVEMNFVERYELFGCKLTFQLFCMSSCDLFHWTY